MVREALETDESLTAQQIQLNDQNEGKTKLALWSNPGDGTLGSLTRSRRVVETVEQMLGGSILHYHSKNLVKYPEEGGVWNWHQVRASSHASSRASLAQRKLFDGRCLNASSATCANELLLCHAATARRITAIGTKTSFLRQI
eukprot:COSAG02_NODE_1350_length_13120_cov_4.275555_6_plen_143_part_00